MAIHVLILLTISQLSISEHIICNTTNNCQNKILECNKKYEDCSFTCSNEYGCFNSTFICPATASLCTIFCINHYSCHSTKIICARNSECNIIGNGKYALAYTKINGPYLRKTNIQCKQDYSCRQSWIDTRHSTNLNLLCHTNTQYDGCHDITLYCPYYSYITNHPTCTIQQTRSRPQQGTHKKLTFYARNSWYDMDISWDISLSEESQMFCGHEYENVCNIKSILIDTHKYEWNCMDDKSYCYTHNEQNKQTWNHIWKGHSVITILFIFIFTIVLIFSCRYGRKSFQIRQQNKNEKLKRKLNHDKDRIHREGRETKKLNQM